MPNRTHVIVTRQKNYLYEGCIVVADLKTAIESCPKDKELFIIGGGEIYKQSIHLADKLDITLVHKSFEADVYFPEIDLAIWELIFEKFNPKDEKHSFDYTFQTYIRKK